MRVFSSFLFCMELAYMLGKGHDTIVLGDYRMNQLLEMLETNPIVAAIKDEAGLETALKSEVGIVFVLHGDLCTLPAIVERIKLKKRMAIVHVDLIEGLSNDEVALDYIKNVVHADGIITTKSSFIQYGKKIGLYTIHRYFVLDSMALQNIIKQAKNAVQPDAIEILPGVLQPKIVRYITKHSPVPVMCGGLVTVKEDVIHCLQSGAIAVSTTRKDLWDL